MSEEMVEHLRQRRIKLRQCAQDLKEIKRKHRSEMSSEYNKIHYASMLIDKYTKTKLTVMKSVMRLTYSQLIELLIENFMEDKNE